MGRAHTSAHATPPSPRAGADGAIPAEVAEPLAQAYGVFDAVTHWQRLTLDDPGAPPSESASRRIARAMDLPDAGTLAAELRLQRRTSRSLLARIKSAKGIPATPPPGGDPS